MWRVYKDNAEENLECSRLLFENKYYSVSYETSFLAIEIAFKSYWLKVNDNIKPSIPSFGKHDLSQILNDFNELDVKLREQGEAYNLLISTLGDSSVWKPWKRYKYRASREIAEHYLNLAERLVKWMLENLLTL